MRLRSVLVKDAGSLISFLYVLLSFRPFHLLKMLLPYLPALAIILRVASSSPSFSRVTSVVNQTICNGEKYIYQELAGYGFLPSDARDKFGDTIGGIGSSIALDESAWKKTNSGYTGKAQGTCHARSDI